MTDREIHDAAVHALRKAENALKAARVLFTAEIYDDAVSRAYYAIFGIARALVVLDGCSFSKHGGVLSHFDREYVKTGIFSKDYSRIIHQAFQERQISDYGIDGIDDFVTKDEAFSSIEDAEKFVINVGKYIKENLS